MKITTDPLRVLQGQGNAQKPEAAEEAAGFSALLARELRARPGETPAAPAINTGQNAAVLAMQIRAARELGSAPATEEAKTDLESAPLEFEEMDKLLEQMGLYAASLAQGNGANLKELSGMLAEVDSGISGLKQRFPALPGSEAGAVLNELEVLAVAERFKFNRGDYL